MHIGTSGDVGVLWRQLTKSHLHIKDPIHSDHQNGTYFKVHCRNKHTDKPAPVQSKQLIPYTEKLKVSQALEVWYMVVKKQKKNRLKSFSTVCVFEMKMWDSG